MREQGPDLIDLRWAIWKEEIFWIDRYGLLAFLDFLALCSDLHRLKFEICEM